MAPRQQDALLHPSIRFLKRIDGLPLLLSEITGLPIEVTSTQKGMKTAMAQIKQHHPRPEERRLPLGIIRIPSAKLAAGIKIHNDLVETAARHGLPFPERIWSTQASEPLFKAAYPNVTDKTRESRARDWRNVMSEVCQLPLAGYERPSADDSEWPAIPNKKLDAPAVQNIIDTLKPGPGNPAPWSEADKLTNTRLRRLRAIFGSAPRYQITERDQAIALSHHALALQGRIPVTVSAATKEQVRQTKRKTGVDLPSSPRKPFKDPVLEAEAQILEQQTRDYFTAKTVLGGPDDDFKAALILPCQRERENSTRETTTIFKAYFASKQPGKPITAAYLDRSELDGRKIDLADKIAVARAIAVHGRVNLPSGVTAIQHHDPHRREPLAYFQPENIVRHIWLDQFQKEELFNSKPYGKGLKDNLYSYEQASLNFALLQFRAHMPELQNSLIAKHLDVHDKLRHGRHAPDLTEIFKSFRDIAKLENYERTAKAIAAAPFLKTLLKEVWGDESRENRAESFATLNRGEPLTQVAKACLKETLAPEFIDQLENRSLKTVLKAKPEFAHHDQTLAALDVRAEKGGTLVNPGQDVADTIDFFAKEVQAIVSNPEHRAIALEQIVAPPRQTYSGVQKLSEDWHRAVSGIKAQTNDRESQIKQDEAEAAGEPFARATEFPVPIAETTIIDGVKITPLKSDHDFSHESQFMQNCVVSYTGEGRNGSLLVLAVESAIERSTAGFRFSPGILDAETGKPDGRAPLFTLFQHRAKSVKGGIRYPGYGTQPPASTLHEIAVKKYLDGILADKSTIVPYNEEAKAAQSISNQKRSRLSVEGQEKLADFRFEQLKPFLGRNDRGLNRQQWLAQISERFEQRQREEDARVRRIEAQKAANLRAIQQRQVNRPVEMAR